MAIPLILAVIAVPLLFGVVPRNWVYGVRTRATMASDEAWFRANKVGGTLLFVTATIWFGIHLLG